MNVPDCAPGTRKVVVRPGIIEAGRSRCPWCEIDDGKPSRRQNLNVSADGLWFCHRCERGGVIAERENNDPHKPHVQRQRRAQPEPDQDAAAKLQALRRRCMPLSDSRAEPARHYLTEVRSIPEQIWSQCSSLRYSPKEFAGQGESWPCLVAVVQKPDGTLAGAHRHYLAADGSGKAPVDDPKRLTKSVMPGDYRGAAIRLTPAKPESPLYVAEGVEDGLSVLTILDGCASVWAVTGTSVMAGLEIPGHVGEVVVCADPDSPGQRAARALVERLLRQGTTARIEIACPAGGRIDFNDLIRGKVNACE